MSRDFPATRKACPVLLLLAVVALGGAAWPEKSGACFIPDGANESDYRNLARSFAGSCLWLEFNFPNGSPFYASATRLNSHYAITAAHVLYPSSGGTSTLVRLGNGTNFITDPGEMRGIAQVLVHPDFVRGNGNYPDIAILKFDAPLPGTDPVITTTNAIEFQVLTSAGFGRVGTPSGPLPVQDGFLRAFNAQVNDLNIWLDGYSEFFYHAVTFGPFDGSPLNGKGLSGDSGGPVFDAHGNLVGLQIAQVGNGSGIGYTIDLRLNTVADWIATNTIVPPTLLSQVVDTNIVLSWTGSFVLQSITNVVEPFVDVPSATSPYTNALSADPQRFFRLRSTLPAARPAALAPAPGMPAPKAPRAHEVELL